MTNILKFASTIIPIILSIYSALCYPSKPLNERSTELAWQAWLLVDDQNQNKQNDVNSLRRRITPKSVFIAPTFSPESLTPCADGYASDVMGRCIKIIKIDEAAHLDFLLQKLNEKFGDYDDDNDETDENENKNKNKNSDTTQGPLQFNIPLNANVDDYTDDSAESGVAIVVAPTNGGRTVVKKKVETENINLNIDNTEDIPTSTIISTTIKEENGETTILNIESSDAIYFFNPTELDGELSTTTTIHPEESTTMENPESTTIVEKINEKKKNNKVKFPDEQNNSRIRFPDEDFDIVNNNNTHHTRDTTKQSDALINSDGKSEELIVTNHRNRDKHNKLFLLPPKWSESSPQKPLFLRLSRNRNTYMDFHKFDHNQPNFYRQLKSDNLSYIFGSRNHHNHHQNNNGDVGLR